MELVIAGLAAIGLMPLTTGSVFCKDIEPNKTVFFERAVRTFWTGVFLSMITV
jgi:hypothetical protein